MGILLVDDDPEVQELVESTLQKSGLSVISVNDGLSALDMAISETPDLILADFLIKGIDISTFVKKIQRRPALANTPIVLLLNRDSDSDPVAHQLAGAYAILKKPLDPFFLSKEVKKQMGIMELEMPEEEEELSFLPIADDFLSSELPSSQKNIQINLDETIDEIDPVPVHSPKAHSPAIAPVIAPAIAPVMGHVDPEKVDEAIRKIVLEVVERVAWEIIPSVVEMAMPKAKIQSFVEQVVWEIVPPLAEIEIKKEIKRLQPDEGFSA
jgi:CheY-like chemotaxis protein